MKSILSLLFSLFGMSLMSFAAGDVGIRDAASDLGGGAPEGGEPDPFDGAGGGEGGDGGDGGEPDLEEETPGGEGGEEETPAEEEETPGGEGGEGREEEPPTETDAERTTREQLERDAAAAGKTVDELKAEREAAAAAAKPKTEEEKLIEKTLQEMYRENPKLKEAFKAYPELRAPFFKAAEINKVYPGGIDEAKRAKEWAGDLFKIDQLYYGSGPQDIDSKRNFLKFMWEESLGADGKSTGHYETIAELVTSETIANIEAVLAQQPGLATQIDKSLNVKQVATALEIVRRAAGILTGKPLPKGTGFAGPRNVDLGVDTTGMTPEMIKIAEENARLRDQLTHFTKTESETTEKNFHSSIYKNFTDGIKPELDKRMPSIVKSGTSRVQKAFVSDVLEEIRKALSADDFFDAQLTAVARSGDRGQRHIEQMSGMMKQRALALLPSIARQVSEEWMKKPDSASNTNKDQRSNSGRGNERPRKEPVIGGSPGRSARPSGRASAGGARQAQNTNKTSGDYNRDANKLLGIDE